MLTIIYNKDGSIKNLKLPTYVNQGSNNVDKVFVAVDGLDTDEYTVSANFRLPNHTTSEIAAASTDEETIDETTYAGRSFYLTTAQTYYVGRLLLSISLTQNANQIKWTYPVEIVINPTTFDPTSDDSNITNAQYYSLLGALNVKQDKYAIGNVRFYKTYTDLVNDIANIVNYQVCATKDSDGNIVFYQKDDGVLVLVEYPITESDYEAILDRLDSLETNKRDKINNTSNKFLLYMSTPSNTESSIQLDDNPSSVTVAWRTGTGELKGETRVASGDKVLVNKLYLATYFYDKTEIDSKISSVYKFKGSVATYDDLPTTDLTIGDVYNVEDTGDNYAWTGTAWDKLAGEIDLSNYYTKPETDDLLNGKQDALVSGTNIKTINNESILGSGNINIQGGGTEYEEGFGIDIANDTISVDTDVITTKEEFNALKLLVEEAIVDTSDYQFNYWDIDNVPITINSYPTLVSAGLDIKALRGRSVAFNQLFNSFRTVTTNGCTITPLSNGRGLHIQGTAESTANTWIVNLGSDYTKYANHKMLIKNNSNIVIRNNDFGRQINQIGQIAAQYFVIDMIAGTVYDNDVELQLFDLSLMGLDNITSVLEFNKLFPETYYGYNAGTMLSSKASALDVVGYNAFGNEKEIGWISTDTGQDIENNANTREIGYTKVIAGQNYTFETTDTTNRNRVVHEYDENKNWIKYTVLYYPNKSITLTNNTHYVRLAYPSTDLTLNWCFHLTLTGAKIISDVYSKQTYTLPNAELKGVGSAYDELKPDGTLITRIGVVDLGTLNWVYAGTYFICESDIGNARPSSSSVAFNGLCAKYVVVPQSNSSDKTIKVVPSNGYLIVHDSSYTDAATFKTAMSGVYLYFETATPTETQTEYTFIDSIESLQDGTTLSQTSSVGLGYIIDTEMAIYKPKGE